MTWSENILHSHFVCKIVSVENIHIKKNVSFCDKNEEHFLSYILLLF